MNHLSQYNMYKKEPGKLPFLPTLEYTDALNAIDIPYLNDRHVTNCNALSQKMQVPQDKDKH